MKDAPEVSWHVKFDSQNLKHSGDLARWSTIIAPHESSIEPKHNLGIIYNWLWCVDCTGGCKWFLKVSIVTRGV